MHTKSEQLPQNASSKIIEDFTIEENRLIKYNGSDPVITIPGHITEIAAHAFADCHTVKKIILPEGLQTICNHAFYHCLNLEEINTPSTLKNIEYGAFTGCHSLKRFKLPAQYAFRHSNQLSLLFTDCKSLLALEVDPENACCTEVDGIIYSNDMKTLIFCPAAYDKKMIQVPETVTVIDNAAFQNCSNIEQIYLPESLEKIIFNAFDNCTSLQSIRIPAGCQKVFPCFRGCTALKEIQVEEGNKTYFSQNGVLMSRLDFSHPSFEEKILFRTLENTYSLFAYPANKEGSEYVIPEFVTHIEKWAFSYNQNLTTINIPEQICSVGESALESCKQLKKIIFSGKMIENLSFRTLAECKNLETVKILSPVREIPSEFLYNCTSLISCFLPDTIESIGYGAFNKCSALESLTLPPKTKWIQHFAFDRCTSLKEITMPETVKCIKRSAFSSCTSLGTVILPAKEVEIEEKAFDLERNNDPVLQFLKENRHLLPEDFELPEFRDDAQLHFYGIEGSSVEKFAQENQLEFTPIGR